MKKRYGKPTATILPFSKPCSASKVKRGQQESIDEAPKTSHLARECYERLLSIVH
jgi:hypothetical protein